MRRTIASVIAGAAVVVSPLVVLAAAPSAHADSLGRPDTVLVSQAPGGVPANANSDRPQISADGRYVTFDSYATNLVPGTVGRLRRVYREDMTTGHIDLISVSGTGVQSTTDSTYSWPDGDGNLVAFVSDSSLAPVVSHGRSVYVRDVAAGTTELISVSNAGKTGNGASTRPMMTANGRFVAFSSQATNLSALGGNGQEQVYVRDRVLGTTTLVSTSATGGLGDGRSYRGMVSADGHYVTWSSYAKNLVPGTAANGEAIYTRDMLTGVTTRVTTRLNGQAGLGTRPYMTPDGQNVAFNSADIFTNDGDTAGSQDTFVWNRTAGTFDRMGASGNQSPTGDSLRLFLSDDARYAVWNSFANNLVPNDGNPAGDVFFKDRQTGVITLLSVSWFGGAANQQSFRPVFSADGSKVAFLSAARNLVQNDQSTQFQVYYMSSASVVAAGLDTTAPTLSASSPASNSAVLNTSPVQFSGSVADDRIVNNVSLQVKNLGTGQWLQPNGSWAAAATKLATTLANPYTGSSTWSYAATLPVGSFGYTVTGYDTSKNAKKAAQVNFTTTATAPDTQPAAATVTAPANNSTVNAPVTVSGNATDNVAVANVYVQIKDTATQLWLRPDGSWGSTVVKLPATLAAPGTPATGWSYNAPLGTGSYYMEVLPYDTSNNVPVKVITRFKVS